MYDPRSEVNYRRKLAEDTSRKLRELTIEMIGEILLPMLS